MKRSALIALPVFCLLCLLCVPCLPGRAAASDTGSDPSAAVATGWHPFRSLTGRFEVVAPGASQRLATSRWTLAGPIEEIAYHFDWRGARFGVTYHDLPRIASVIFTPESLLERAEAELVEVMGGRLLGAEALTAQGWPGRSVTYQVPGRPGVLEEARLFLVGMRLYIVEAATRAASSGQAAAEAGAPATRFLDSFRLLAPDGAPY